LKVFRHADEQIKKLFGIALTITDPNGEKNVETEKIAFSRIQPSKTVA
jgi:hypothetical protein